MIMPNQLLRPPNTQRSEPSGAHAHQEVGSVSTHATNFNPPTAPLDQATQLRRLVRQSSHQSPRRARVLAVTSGKGGVGKTNVAANLAICLAAAGKRVILLDADLGLANLDILLPVKSHLNLAQVVAGTKHITEILQPGPAGLRMICGASGLAFMENLSDRQRDHLIHEMASLEHDADLIIVDTAAGISPNVLAFCHAADYTLVVTTPEPTSITDAYAVIKVLAREYPSPAGRGWPETSAEFPSDQPRATLSLLVNCADNRDQAKQLYRKIASIATRFLDTDLYDAGFVLRDPRLSQAVRKRKPLVLAYPRCPAATCFLALAQKFNRANADPALAPHRDHPGFFRKLLDWLS